MSKTSLPYRLFAPGPVPMAPEIIAAMSKPMVHHRSAEFSQILEKCLQQLKSVFGTNQPVMILPSTGSGAMEAAITNTLSSGDEIIVVESGKFGERWVKMAQSYGVQVHSLKVEWGHSLNVNDLESALKENPKVKAVLSQVSETSTGALHPVNEMAELLKSYPKTLFILDAITGIGATPLPMDEWELDVVVAGSQKAFQLPTGLSFIAMSERAWQFQSKSNIPKFYLDLMAEKKANSKNQTHFSSSVSLINGLSVLLNKWEGEGLCLQMKRCEDLSKITREFIQDLGLDIFASHPSPSVTSISCPEGLSARDIQQHLLKEFNLFVAGGQDHLKGKIIRIGHLGYITNEDQLFLFESLVKTLSQLYPQHLKVSQTEEALRKAKESLANTQVI